jgi:flagellar FliJ protein
MAFRFSLQPILKLRASLERLEQLRLLAIAALIARVCEEIAALEVESRDARQSLQERLAAGMAGAEIHYEAMCEKLRADRKKALEAQLEGLEGRQERQRLAFQAARQKREILENLRQRRWEDYRREQARREQKAIDELFLLRHGTTPHE